MLHHIYNSNLVIIGKLQKGLLLNDYEKRDLENLPHIMMICYLNGFEEAKQKLIDAGGRVDRFNKKYGIKIFKKSTKRIYT